jgi:hypothetical protein
VELLKVKDPSGVTWVMTTEPVASIPTPQPQGLTRGEWGAIILLPILGVVLGIRRLARNDVGPGLAIILASVLTGTATWLVMDALTASDSAQQRAAAVQPYAPPAEPMELTASNIDQLDTSPEWAGTAVSAVDAQVVGVLHDETGTTMRVELSGGTEAIVRSDTPGLKVAEMDDLHIGAGTVDEPWSDPDTGTYLPGIAAISLDVVPADPA